MALDCAAQETLQFAAPNCRHDYTSVVTVPLVIRDLAMCPAQSVCAASDVDGAILQAPALLAVRGADLLWQPPPSRHS